MLTYRNLIGLLLVAVILIGFAFYRSCTSGDRLNVTPEAAEKIEKAKRR